MRGLCSLLPPSLVILLFCGCMSFSGAVDTFDRMVPQPTAKMVASPGRSFEFEPAYSPNPWLLWIGTWKESPGDCLLVMGEATEPAQINTACLRLIFTLSRAGNVYCRLLALASLNRIVERIGPSADHPKPNESGSRPTYPALDQAFRQKLAKASPEGNKEILRQAINACFLAALFDPAEPVRQQAFNCFYQHWGEKGASFLFWLCEMNLPYLFESFAALGELINDCGSLTPARARAGGEKESVFAHLNRYIQCDTFNRNRIFSRYQMIAMRSVCRILGQPPSYDRKHFSVWWKQEVATWKGEPR